MEGARIWAASLGNKTATASLRHEYEPHTDELPPEVGESCLLVGSGDEPLAVVETTEVCVVSACQVDLRFARDEGGGFKSVADWRVPTSGFRPTGRSPTRHRLWVSGSG